MSSQNYILCSKKTKQKHKKPALVSFYFSLKTRLSSHIFSCPIRTSLIASAVECAGFLYGWMVRGPSGCQGLDWTALTEAVSEVIAFMVVKLTFKSFKSSKILF